ncbi:MAG: hypothetical protein ACSW8K_12660, partial [bacterium]
QEENTDREETLSDDMTDAFSGGEDTASGQGMSRADTMEALGIEEYIFEPVRKNAWLLEDSVLKAEPFEDAEDIRKLVKLEKVKICGINSCPYWEVTVGRKKGYVLSSVLTTTAALVNEMTEDTSILQDQLAMKIRAENEAREIARQELTDDKNYEAWRSSLASQTRSYYWNGPVLSKSAGAVYGPNGKETYYNLNMNGVIATMRRMGYYGEYWVRNDGCKMLGDYIMCAANLSVHPRGSLVECSLGTCIVCDTGGFAAHNPNQLDIATTW